MKKIYLFLAAVASVALVGCTSDLLVADTPSQLVDDEEGSAIIFSSLSKATTRADFTGAEAAAKLDNKFVVAGKKGSTTAATDGTVVFDNYLVEYAENTAHTTESNVANWEYVGKGRIKHAIDHGITSQTIKYWDYSKPQYDFIAWSTGTKTAIFEGTPVAGEVLVSAINPNATATAAYTFQGTADDLSECYIADLVTVKKAQYADKDHENPVTFHFRQLGTKVRIGIYETIPGYSVKNVQFYSAADVNLVKAGDAKPVSGTYTAAEAAEVNASARLFTTVANDIYTEGKYTVTFPTVDDMTPAEDKNKAHVTFEAKTGVDQTTTVDWGGLNYTIAEEGEQTPGNVFLGRTSNTASFAGNADANYYVIFLPNETGTNLNLRVNYTLESIDGGGEEIIVKGATAQVPGIYTQWKPGYAYTYIFKISDKTNGHTGVYDPTQPDNTTVNSDPAGLYPITFDAVVENAEDNDATQETITLVSTPSITTYQKGSSVVNDNEYQAATGPIFVTVNDGTTADTPDLANGALQDLTGKAALYTIPAGKTEAVVIDALQMQDDDIDPSAPAGTIKGRSGLVLTPADFELTDKVQYGVDGNTISLTDGTKKKALQFTGSANTYAFVYTKTAPDADNNVVKYQAVAFTDATVTNKYRYAYEAIATPGDAQKGVKYFSVSGGVYTMETPFIGQGVGNLYLDATGTTIASGYAATGTTYYYTTNSGMSYQAAHNVNYADFDNTLFVWDDGTNAYVATTDATPQDGTAYYYYDTVNDKYIYCVILPQQTTGWFELDTDTYVVADEAAAVAGQTYFDKYVKNDGVYYVKVIKVQ